jgi:hypothetical protein
VASRFALCCRGRKVPGTRPPAPACTEDFRYPPAGTAEPLDESGVAAKFCNVALTPFGVLADHSRHLDHVAPSRSRQRFLAGAPHESPAYGRGRPQFAGHEVGERRGFLVAGGWRCGCIGALSLRCVYCAVWNGDLMAADRLGIKSFTGARVLYNAREAPIGWGPARVRTRAATRSML